MKKQIHGLERHRYAPELNCLHYTDGTEVPTPQCTTIEEAVQYLEGLDPDPTPVDYAANFIREMAMWLDRRPETDNDGKTIDQLINEFKNS